MNNDISLYFLKTLAFWLCEKIEDFWIWIIIHKASFIIILWLLTGFLITFFIWVYNSSAQGYQIIGVGIIVYLLQILIYLLVGLFLLVFDDDLDIIKWFEF